MGRAERINQNIWMWLAVLLLVSLLCGNARAGAELQGKGISILGDSISTYAGVSNNASANSTTAINEVLYADGGFGIYREDTWWQQAIDALGADLVVNNSWSASAVLSPLRGWASVGYGMRCENLHTDAGRIPDIIAVYMGTNDWGYARTVNPNLLGTEKAIAYDKLIADAGDGSYTYAVPTTVCEAYAVMLHKIQTKYPQAEIYCFTLLPRRDPDYYTGLSSVWQTSGFNEQIRALARHFGCRIVDLESCGITKYPKDFDPCFVDMDTHPNEQGMDLIAEAFVSTVLGRDVKLYDVAIQSPGLDLQVDMQTPVIGGNAYTVQLVEADRARDIAVTVTMNGEDISASCYADGAVSIPAVTGDVQIEVAENSRNYLWRMEDGQFVNVSGWENSANGASLLAGGNVSGVFYNARYALADSMELLHHRDWAVEWKGTGRGMTALTSAAGFTLNEPYFFREQNSQIFAFGVCDGSYYHNYGILLPADIDPNQEHIYRLENHVYSYGGNMVYLYVDGVEIGPLNSYFIGNTSMGMSDNWISGKDFVFSYLGAEGFPMSGMSMEYLQVWEDDAPSARCEHVEIIDMGLEPGCTQTGLTSSSHCALCTLTLVPQEVIPAKGHSLEQLPAVEPGCTESGLTEGIHCAACGEILMEQGVLEPLGHSEAVDAAVEPTCTENGLKQGSHCSVCREILHAQEIIPATGHVLAFEQAVYELEADGEGQTDRVEFACGHDVPLNYSASLGLEAERDASGCALLQGGECGVAVLTAETDDAARSRAECRVIVHAARKLTLPSAMKDVAEETFTGLAAQEIVLGGEVRSIGPKAFANCTDLRLIQLPRGAEIADDAFEGCDQLTILCREGDDGHAYALAHEIPYIFLP